MKASTLMLSLFAITVAAGPALAKPVKAPVRTPVGLNANVSTTPRQPSLTKEQRIRLLCASGQLSGVACTAIPIKKG